MFSGALAALKEGMSLSCLRKRPDSPNAGTVTPFFESFNDLFQGFGDSIPTLFRVEVLQKVDAVNSLIGHGEPYGRQQGSLEQPKQGARDGPPESRDQRGNTIADHPAAGSQDSHGGANVRAAARFQDNVEQSPFLPTFPLVIRQCFRGAKGEHKVLLCPLPDQPDHLCPGLHRHLDRGRRHSPRGPRHEHPVSRAHARHLHQRNPCRCKSRWDGGGFHVRKEGRRLSNERRGHHDLRGVASEPGESQHPVSGAEGRDLGSGLRDSAGNLETGNKRGLGGLGIKAHSHLNVGKVDSGGPHPDADAVRRKGRRRHLPHAQHLGSAETGNDDGAHGAGRHLVSP